MSSHAVLTAEAHRDLRVRPERSAATGDAVMSCLVVPTEFRRVANEYPILFQRNAARDGFVALALFGFETGENLFLAGGRWDARYLPLAMEIQPFLIGRGPAGDDGETRAQVHVDLASPRLGADGVRVFDEEGRTTPYLEMVAERLGDLDEGYRESQFFLAALDRHQLLEPTTAEITLDDGSINRLVGFHAIDEGRLAALDAAALGELHGAGHLLPIFMAVASIGRLGELIRRKNRQVGHG